MTVANESAIEVFARLSAKPDEAKSQVPTFRRGEFGVVWDCLVTELIVPIGLDERSNADLYPGLYRVAAKQIFPPVSPGRILEVVEDSGASFVALQDLTADSFRSEAAIIDFIEDAYEETLEIGGAELADNFFELILHFIWKHGLRYEIRRPMQISVSARGMFSSVIDEMRRMASLDTHQSEMLSALEDSIHELSLGETPVRQKRCLQAFFNYFEALTSSHPDVKPGVLSSQVKQIKSWPHAAIAASLLSLYGFASDYPGVRHGGNPASSLRELETKDIGALMVVLTGFIPFVGSEFDGNVFSRDRRS